MKKNPTAYGLENVVAALIQAYPPFYQPIVKEASHWIDEDGAILMTVLFGSLASLIKENVSAGKFDGLPGAFQVIEDIVAGENETMATAAATGFLESLLSHGKEFDTKLFTEFLRPHAKAFCIEWDRFTGIKTDGLYD